MRIRTIIVSLIALLTLAGCSSFSVVSDYDSSMPFGMYRTYRWSAEGSSRIGDDVLAKNPLIYKHIRSAVDRELQAKGFQLREKGPVDFIVSTSAGIHERVTIGPPTVGVYYHYGHYWRGPRYSTGFWYDPYGPYPRLTYYEEGTLVIDIIDAKRDDIAWRGVGRGILKDYESTTDMHHDIDTAVMKILAKFPPISR
jgi:Domain of unknown function (DUF4136)